jgi:hypothetical protein
VCQSVALDTGWKGSGVMRMTNGGRLDFWTLENEIAGRGRRYHRIVIDEAAFTKDGDNKVDGSMQLWETAIDQRCTTLVRSVGLFEFRRDGYRPK